MLFEQFFFQTNLLGISSINQTCILPGRDQGPLSYKVNASSILLKAVHLLTQWNK